MKRILLFIIGLFIFAGCSSTENFGDPITEGEPTPVPTAVVPSRPVYTVERGDIIDERTFYGRVAPIVSERLAFTHEGRVLALHVERGGLVQQGDLIAELDTSLLEQSLSIAQSDLEIAQTLLGNVESQVSFQTQRAQLQLDLAQLELDYAQSQADNPPTPEQAFEITSLEIKRDLAQLALDEVDSVIDPQLQVDVTRAEDRIDDILAEIEQMYLYAPMDGTITSLQIDEGDTVSAHSVIGLVSDESNLEVRDTLDEATLEEIYEGMPVRLQPQNVPGETITGIVLTLPAPYGTGEDEFVHIRFDDVEAASEIFASNDRVTIIGIVNQRDDVLWLPRPAVREFNGRYFVVIEEDGAQHRVDVVLGTEGGGRVEIVEGVEEGQTVIGQ